MHVKVQFLSCFLTLLQCWDVEKNEEKIKTKNVVLQA
jgi:hypothetical protein